MISPVGNFVRLPRKSPSYEELFYNNPVVYGNDPHNIGTKLQCSNQETFTIVIITPQDPWRSKYDVWAGHVCHAVYVAVVDYSISYTSTSMVTKKILKHCPTNAGE